MQMMQETVLMWYEGKAQTYRTASPKQLLSTWLAIYQLLLGLKSSVLCLERIEARTPGGGQAAVCSVLCSGESKPGWKQRFGPYLAYLY